jgi:hypothetical protein
MSMAGAARSEPQFLDEDEVCTHAEAIDRCVARWPNRWIAPTIAGARAAIGHLVVEDMPNELDRIEAIVLRAMPAESGTFQRRRR